MKAASAQEIKKALKEKSAPDLLEICLRLSRYKKENKELLTYLLFEQDDLPAYIASVQTEIDAGFAELNVSNYYLAKKGIRKVLRITNKYIRYAGDKTVEAELLLHFCIAFKRIKESWQKTAALDKTYSGQIKKIGAALDTMHEDLQWDYRRRLERVASSE